MIRKSLILALLLCAALPAANASAAYTISKGEAQRSARDAASTKYAPWGITYSDTVASCRPQGVPYDPRYNYHRWACGWAGRDYDGDIAGGQLRITGHSDGTYGWMVMRGIRWV